MARLQSLQSSFTAGELSAELYGRADLASTGEGASSLQNVFVLPTGGVYRRPGLVHVADAASDGRLVGYEAGNGDAFLLVFSDGAVDVYQDDALVTTLSPAPWALADLEQISWVQNADMLLVMHPDVPPQTLSRDGAGTWAIDDWPWAQDIATGVVKQPYHKYAATDVIVTPAATTGTGVNLSASSDAFDAAHVGTRLRIGGKEVEVASYVSATLVTIDIIETLGSTTATADWVEQAFSAVQGWPVSACFHQDRLVIGGAGGLSNRLWLSRTGDLFNFDTGTGLDDEAIAFGVQADQINAIRAVVSGRHLQIFTSGAEWMVSGEPLTPGNIQVKSQTRIGSMTDRQITPVNVDGASIFIARGGGGLREFIYTDLEQAYQASDIALMASHLLAGPRAMDFDAHGRHLMIVMDDGTLAALTLYRAEKVVAWSRQLTQGDFRSLAQVGDETYVLVLRAGTVRVERFDDDFNVDAGVFQTAGSPTTTWDGFDHLEGVSVKIVADGVPVSDGSVSAGTIELDYAASAVEAGLGFTHIIAPMPPGETFGRIAAQGATSRLICVTLRLKDTTALSIDTGRGLRDVPFKRFGSQALDQPLTPFSGDKRIGAFGWRRGGITPLWRIEQDTPKAFTLLSVATEYSING